MPTPQVRNVSPLGKLYVPALEREVDPGEALPVDDVDVARSLVAQVGVWEPANAAAKGLLPEDPEPQPAEGEGTATAQEG